VRELRTELAIQDLQWEYNPQHKGGIKMLRCSHLLFAITFVFFTMGPAAAETGVVCGRGGCRTVNVPPGCYIRHVGIYSWRVCGRPPER
jgi:hypothetical protein